MADHLIQQLNDALATKITGLATTGANVFQDRVDPLDDGEFPCLVIADQDEGIPELVALGLSSALGRGLLRTVMFDIVAYVEAASGLGSTLNQIQKEVEVALAADTTLGGLSQDVRYVGRTRTMSGDGKKPVGGITMNYLVSFRSSEKQPDTVG